MADVIITAANVQPGTGSDVVKQTATAAVAITAGQAVILNSSGQWDLLDQDLVIASTAVVGVAMNGAAAGQPVEAQRSGEYTVGGTVAAGTSYYGSSTAGGINSADAITTNKYAVFLGFGTSTSKIRLTPVCNGVAHA